MTADDMIRAADRARHEGRHEEATQWISLCLIISRIEAARRLAARPRDDAQFDYENEAAAQGVDIKELMR